MSFRSGEIDGVVIRELSRHSDDRGWLAELFRSDETPHEMLPVMGYVSSTEPGVVRDPHEHREQSDLEAGAEQPKSMIIPPGVVHAYRNIGTTAGWVFNLSNRLYAGEGRKEEVDEIRHENDPNTMFKLD